MESKASKANHGSKDQAELLGLGKQRAWGIIGLTLSISLLVISHAGLSPIRVVRLCLTVGLLYFFYQGHNWARIVLGILFFAVAAFGADILVRSGGHWLLWYATFGYATSATLLGFSKPLRTFLAEKRSGA